MRNCLLVVAAGSEAFSAFRRKVEAAAYEVLAAHRGLGESWKVSGCDPPAANRGHRNHRRATITMTGHPTRHVRHRDQTQGIDLSQLKMVVVGGVAVATLKLAAAVMAVVVIAGALAAKVHSQHDMRWKS
jgi:hypothetical protein